MSKRRRIRPLSAFENAVNETSKCCKYWLRQSQLFLEAFLAKTCHRRVKSATDGVDSKMTSSKVWSASMPLLVRPSVDGSDWVKEITVSEWGHRMLNMLALIAASCSTTA